MPLSKDPEKRANSLRNLSKGGAVAAERHGITTLPAAGPTPPEGAPPAPTKAAEPAGGEIPVVGYGPLDEPAPAPAAPAAPVVEDHQEHDHEPAIERHEPETREEPAASRSGLGGLMDGFLGR